MSAFWDFLNTFMMSNTLGILLSVFWLSLVRSDDRGVYYDTATRSWHESSANCQQLGAWEEGDFSIAGFGVPTRPSGFRQDQFFWIGARVHQTPWVKLLGCFETYDSTEHMPFTEVEPLPNLPNPMHHCFGFCDGFDGITAIGISKTSCFCYTDVEKYRKKKEECVYETFPEYPGELFGGPKDESVVVYQYIKHGPLTQVDDFGNCAAVRYLGSLPVPHQFSSCLNRIGYICANGQVSTAEVNWTEAVKRCGILKTDLNGHYTGLTDSVKYRAFWTGFYRRSYALWQPPEDTKIEAVCQRCVSTNPDRMHCVAVKVNDDGTLDSIIYPQDCSKKLPSLCEKSTKVDGGWTEWSLWSECVIGNDGQGSRKKDRTCTNPSPQHGGNDCKGEGEKKENCTPPSEEL